MTIACFSACESSLHLFCAWIIVKVLPLKSMRVGESCRFKDCYVNITLGAKHILQFSIVSGWAWASSETEVSIQKFLRESWGHNKTGSGIWHAFSRSGISWCTFPLHSAASTHQWLPSQPDWMGQWYLFSAISMTFFQKILKITRCLQLKNKCKENFRILLFLNGILQCLFLWYLPLKKHVFKGLKDFS